MGVYQRISSHSNLETAARVYCLDQIAPRIRHEIQSYSVVTLRRRSNVGKGIGDTLFREPAFQGDGPRVQG